MDAVDIHCVCRCTCIVHLSGLGLTLEFCPNVSTIYIILLLNVLLPIQFSVFSHHESYMLILDMQSSDCFTHKY